MVFDAGHTVASHLASQFPLYDEPILGVVPEKLAEELKWLEASVWRDIAQVGPLWSNVRLVVDGRDQHPSRFMNGRIGDGLVVHSWPDVPAITKALKGGATLVYNHLHETSPSLQRLQESLEYLLDARVWIQAYLTQSERTAFGPHVDDHNFIVLQLSGRKSWALSKTSGLDQELQPEHILNRGAFYVVPSNTMHGVTGVGEVSLHLTIAFDWNERSSTYSWGSVVPESDLPGHRNTDRLGHSWRSVLKADAAWSPGMALRFAPRIRPQLSRHDNHLALTAPNGTVIKLDLRAKELLESLISGRQLSYEDVRCLSPALTPRTRSNLIAGLAEIGLVFTSG